MKKNDGIAVLVTLAVGLGVVAAVTAMTGEQTETDAAVAIYDTASDAFDTVATAAAAANQKAQDALDAIKELLKTGTTINEGGVIITTVPDLTGAVDALAGVVADLAADTTLADTAAAAAAVAAAAAKVGKTVKDKVDKAKVIVDEITVTVAEIGDTAAKIVTGNEVVDITKMVDDLLKTVTAVTLPIIKTVGNPNKQ